jgi:hypothetical protein
MRGFATERTGGFVDVHAVATAAMVHDTTDELADWIRERLVDDDRLVSKIEKLVAAEADERHLFLRVDDSGVPAEHFHPLSFGTTAPTAHNEPHPSLDGLWLLPPWGRTVLRWHRPCGWERFDYSRPEDP